MTSTEWKSWCRLCAGTDGNELKLDTIKCVLDVLQKFFRISIFSSDDCISVVCQDCLNLVLNVEKFALRCAKVNNMFMELKDDVSDDKVDSVRQKYGLFESEDYRLEAIENLQSTSKNLETPPVDEVKFTEMHVTKDLFHTETEGTGSDCAVSFADEDDVEDNDTSCPDDRNKLTTGVARQLKAKKRNRYSKANSNRSTAKKHKISTESKSKTMRKPVKGTDVWCHLCNTTFDLPRLYMEHMRGKHTPDVLPFGCAHCPKFFVSEKKMLQHAACHRPVEQKKIHPCPECDRSFTRAENVQLHIRNVHFGDRPYVCEECGKAWATKGALKRHQIMHTDARQFKCSVCSKTFKDPPSLKKHLETHSTVSFECLLCGQPFSTRYTLKVHMLVHSDEKRHKCQYCDNAFKRYKALKNHLNLHTGMRPYKCPFCDVSYANGPNLRAHKKKCHSVELAAMEAVAEERRPS